MNKYLHYQKNDYKYTNHIQSTNASISIPDMWHIVGFGHIAGETLFCSKPIIKWDIKENMNYRHKFTLNQLFTRIYPLVKLISKFCQKPVILGPQMVAMATKNI